MEPKIINSEIPPKEATEFFEIEIAKCEEKTRLLRLLCLFSVTNNGIPKDHFATLTKEYIDAFGVSELLRIMNLERVGILKQKQSGGIEWAKICEVYTFPTSNIDIQIS